MSDGLAGISETKIVVEKNITHPTSTGKWHDFGDGENLCGVVCERVLPYSAEKSHDYPLCISSSSHSNNHGREKNRENCQADFPHWVDSSCSIKHGGRQVDKAHCEGQARSGHRIQNFMILLKIVIYQQVVPSLNHTHSPRNWVLKIRMAIRRILFIDDRNMELPHVFARWRKGVVAVNLPNDGSACKSIYSEGAAPTNCPPDFLRTLKATEMAKWLLMWMAAP